MTRRYLILFALLLAAFFSGPLASPAAGQQATPPINSYTVVHLGHLGRGGSTANGLNDSGHVVGGSYASINGVSAQRAFRWVNGVMTDLGTLGGSQSQASAINNTGQVVGWANTAAAATHAFLWSAETGMQDLGTLGGSSSSASGINDAGQVVGTAVNAAGVQRACLWQIGQMVDLGTLPGYVSSVAYGINASGQVVGYAADASGQRRAFRWTPSTANGTTGTMAALDGSAAGNVAYGINGPGVAVGESWHWGDLRPTVWGSTGGSYHLPFLYSYGFAYGINDAGYVVGKHGYDIWDDSGYYIQTHIFAFLWDSLNGTRDLSALTGGLASLDNARAINASGQIAGRALLLTPSPLPGRPSLLWVSGIGDTRVELRWHASSGADRYSIKRSTISGGPYTTIAAGVLGTTYADTAVVNGTRYYYVVSAVNAYGESANSNEATAMPVPVPLPPAGLTAVAGDQQVTLSWNASAWADYYKVYISTTPGGPYNWWDHTSQTSYVDYPLENGTTTYYVVTAVNMAGESGYSNESSATPVPPPPPPAPTGLTATAGNGQVFLAWTASPGASMYRIKRGTSAGGPYTTIDGTWPGTTYSDNQVENGTTYYYVVSASNNGGESPNSSEVSATPTGAPPPAAPTNLTATAEKKVTLKWTQSTSSGVTQNRIYRATTSGGPYSLRATISAGMSFSDTGLTSGVSYYYVVTAVNSSGKESVYSNEASAKPR